MRQRWRCDNLHDDRGKRRDYRLRGSYRSGGNRGRGYRLRESYRRQRGRDARERLLDVKPAEAGRIP